MAFSRFDDSLDGHPKMRKAGLAAVGLWTQAIVHSARHLTDGHVDAEWVEEKVPGSKQRETILARLLDSRLFETNGGSGYVIHDYLDFNPSREEVLERRRKAAERKAAQRMSQGDTNGTVGGTHA